MTRPIADGGLIVFLRLPRKGHVKTRLAKSVGPDKALDIYLQLVERTITTIRNLQCPIYFFYEGGLPELAEQLPAIHYYLQSKGDLGQRMQEAISFVLDKHSKAVIIGSDCPGLTDNIINHAFTILDAHDVVIGPAVDGGYYLLGCKRIHPNLFNGIPWSSALVTRETIDRCIHAALSHALLPELRDVDTLEDYLLLKHQVENK